MFIGVKGNSISRVPIVTLRHNIVGLLISIVVSVLFDRTLDGLEVFVVRSLRVFFIFLRAMICCNIPNDKSDINGNGIWNKLPEEVENTSDHPKFFDLLITRINNAIVYKRSPNVNHKVF